MRGFGQKERILIRARTKARSTRTLTFILSLTGRGNGNRGADQDFALRVCPPDQIPPLPESETILLSPLPVRERMKVRVRMQRASSARESRFCLSSSSLRTSKKLIDRAKHFLHTLKHLAVPESKHAISLRIEKRGAGFIFTRSLKMLRAIEFDDDPPFRRAEVSEVRPNRELTAKLGVAHLTASQMLPQDSFSVGLFATQPPRILLGRHNRPHHLDCLSSPEETQARGRRHPLPSPLAANARVLLSHLPVRERMKVRVLIQRAIPRATQDSVLPPFDLVATS